MQKNSSLGKGLAELLGEKNFNFFDENESKNKIINVEITKIIPSPYQPRKIFDNSALIELSESIKTKGVLQPILVREANGNYEIIAGERRFRAAKLAFLTEIPAIILSISDEDAMEIALIENIQRQQLTPIEEANAIAKLINDLNYTHENLSHKIGKSRSHITNMLRLLNLPKSIQNLLNEDQISIGHARTLINIENPEIFTDKIINENLSVRDTEALVKANKNNSITDNGLNNFDIERKQYLNEIKDQIQSQISLKTKVKHNGKKGTIEITFKTINELESFIEKIN
ncbi:MAG: ParB/RepB/Spo0J family partition protein [Rickettsiales bacterium]|nr:ParB/RepB/Spo0J family partition protein [Rickettsiales bacterium]